MCGIAGSVWPRAGADDWRGLLLGMGDSMSHRGPDDAGEWWDPEAGVGLAHRRLAVLDVSAAGHQPMVSASGRFVISYNGEVFNFRELQAELSGAVSGWRSQSDTEVILAAFEAWGVERAVSRFMGQFAFAVWDRHERELSLVRDRLGIKPLYYGRAPGAFVFASDLAAFHRHPAFEPTVDRDAVALFMRFQYVPAPYSIYQGVRKLEPGEILRLQVRDSRVESSETTQYWSARQVAREGQQTTSEIDEREATDQLDILLNRAVGRRMISDVPVGALLSGGIDSSTITAMMQAQSAVPVRTFTVGFDEGDYDEAAYAQRIAAHLGTDHTEVYLSPADALDVIPKIPAIYSEPFADPSQIPTYLISSLASRHVTVALSGDGGDELFAGYTRYGRGRALWTKLAWMPAGVRKAVAQAILKLPSGPIDAGLKVLRRQPAGERLRALGEAMQGPDIQTRLYQEMVTHWRSSELLVPGAKQMPTSFSDGDGGLDLSDFTHRMMMLDMISYLPDDILVKTDRASMAASLEMRVPLLDHEVVEFAWNLPLSLKLRGNKTKWLLDQVLERYLPRHLTDRPKQGFTVPIQDWLRGPLREWAEDLLAPEALRSSDLFDCDRIRNTWDAYLSGRDPLAYNRLWDVLMFQAWMEHHGSTLAVSEPAEAL